MELLFFFTINFIRKNFQWLITKKEDFIPKLNKIGLDKFINDGFNSFLGWDRRSLTNHDEIGKYGITKWNIDSHGSRLNPFNDNNKNYISTFGDSYTFCRQVNDNETWQFYLSQMTKSNVINWGVGNYGIDQAFLKYINKSKLIKSKYVIIGVVPDTISRILSTWKHYYEYGNTFGFKPRYVIEDNNLKLVENVIKSHKDFESYKEKLLEINKYDFFYESKFLDEIIYFPYIISFFRNPLRNFKIIMYILLSKLTYKSKYFIDKAFDVIMKINLKWRVGLYGNKNYTELLEKIILEFKTLCNQNNQIFILAIMPQKDDIIFAKKNFHFYKDFIRIIENKVIIYDFMEKLIKVDDINKYYSDNTKYGGHLSLDGNKLFANEIFNFINNLNKQNE